MESLDSDMKKECRRHFGAFWMPFFFFFCSTNSFDETKTCYALDRFSFQCRDVVDFALTTPDNWLKKLALLLHPITNKTKTNHDTFSCASRQVGAITSSFDWLTVLSVSFVID